MWAVKRDGVVKEVCATEALAFSELLRMQPMSTDWAIKYEGWSIAELGEDECYGCGLDPYHDGPDPALVHPKKWSTEIVALVCSQACADKINALRDRDGVLHFPEVP